MITVLKSTTFTTWIDGLKDRTARARILTRLDRVAAGNLGDVKPVGAGVSELRITYGPGYRVYILTQGADVVVLLCGGDKSSQPADIARAKLIAQQWRTP
jgi:putative addiction module killer protein